MKNTSVILLILLGLSLFSCKKAPENKQETQVRLNGNIDYIDQFGYTIKSVEGTQITVNETGESVIANEAGQFKLFQLEEGNQYSLEIYKESFTHLKNYKFVYTKNMNFPDIILSEMSDTHIDSIFHHSPPYDDLPILLYSSSPDDTTRCVNIYCHSESNVSFQNYLYKETGFVKLGFASENSILSEFWDFTEYDKVYIKIYPKPKGNYTLDFNDNGVEIDPGVNLNNVLSSYYQLK